MRIVYFRLPSDEIDFVFHRATDNYRHRVELSKAFGFVCLLTFLLSR